MIEQLTWGCETCGEGVIYTSRSSAPTKHCTKCGGKNWACIHDTGPAIRYTTYEVRICPKCRATKNDKDQFCEDCGTKLVIEERQQADALRSC